MRARSWRGPALALAAIVSLALPSMCMAQSIPEFPVTLEPVVHVQNTHFLRLQKVEVDDYLRGVWSDVEACMGFEAPIEGVTFYFASAIIEQYNTPVGQRVRSLWGIYYDSPPEIVISPLDVDSAVLYRAIIQHEIAHHFVQIVDGDHDHTHPDFLRCSGEEESP